MSRRFNTTSTATLLLSVSAALSTACSGADPTHPSSGSDPAGANDAPAAPQADPDLVLGAEVDLLTEHTTHDSVSYRFLQLENGELALEMSTESKDVLPLMPESTETYVEFFERLTDSPAPEALADAQLAAANAEIGDALASPEGEGASGEPARELLDGVERVALERQSSEFAAVQQSLTSAEFQAKYCPGGYDFLYCWPNVTGKPWVQWTSTYLAGAISPSTCSVRFRYRYYDGNWKTLVDRWAGPGSAYWYWSKGSRRSRRFEVLSASCSMHFSVWGNY